MADLYLSVTIHQYSDGSMELMVPVKDEGTAIGTLYYEPIPLRKTQQKSISAMRYLNWVSEKPNAE